jgi:hypothetical protein
MDLRGRHVELDRTVGDLCRKIDTAHHKIMSAQLTHD